MRPLVGIDVGWSVRRRRCALATSGQVSQDRGRRFRQGVRVGLYRLDELLEELARLVGEHRDAFRSAVLVIDGPVGPEIEAVSCRLVDSAFSCGGFVNRAPAYALSHASGQKLSETSAQILRLLNSLAPPIRPWLGGELPSDGLIVAETNPTPAMAIFLPQQDVSTLPSRKHPKKINGTVIRSKSDWYWRLGAGRYAARVLDDPSIASEANHERIAGLFTLALASALAGSETGSVAALGDRDGIYLVPAEIDETWTADVDRVGVAHGQVTFVRNEVAIMEAESVQTLKGGVGKAGL